MAVRDPIREGLAAGWKVFDAAVLGEDLDLQCDVAIVGSGAVCRKLKSSPISRCTGGARPPTARSNAVTISGMAAWRAASSAGKAPASTTGTSAPTVRRPRASRNFEGVAASTGPSIHRASVSTAAPARPTLRNVRRDGRVTAAAFA